MSPLPTGDSVTTVKTRRTYKGTEQRRERLLDTVAALIAKKGYEAASMRDVSEALGVSPAGLYYHFKSKEDLLYQIQFRTFEALLKGQEAVAAVPGTAEERFRRLMHGHLAFFLRHPNELKVCTYEMESLRGELFDTVEDLRRTYYRLFSAVVAELMGDRIPQASKAARSRHASLFVFGMLNWIFMWYDAARHGTVEQIGDEMIDLALNGLRPR
jgi:TetR/AcrR family transcriptional regulator, cholesterol catabolism regulator